MDHFENSLARFRVGLRVQMVIVITTVSIALCVVFFYQPKPNISQLSNSEIVFMIVFGTASSNGRYDRFAKNLVTNEVWSKVETIEVLLTN